MSKKSIRFNEEAETLIKQISPQGEVNYNYSVLQIMHRYSVLCKTLEPSFSPQEWLAICQSYNGHFFHSDIELEAKAFGWHIREAIQYDENVRELFGDYDETNWSEFTTKIDELTIPKTIAVFQRVHEFWANNRG